MSFAFVDTKPDEIIKALPILRDSMEEFTKLRDVFWSSEQLYGALFLGMAHLTLILQDDDLFGFSVHRWMIENTTSLKYMHIWLFYVLPEHRNESKEGIEATKEYLVQKCRDNGNDFMEFQTSREGWGRMLGPDFELTCYTYRMRV
jgi:hypothetical protein